jgi:hypothetical protein
MEDRLTPNPAAGLLQEQVNFLKERMRERYCIDEH